MVASRRSFLLLAAIVPLMAQDVDDTARRLAVKMAATLKPREAAAVALRSLPSFGAADLAGAQRTIQRELRAQGLAVVERTQAAADIQVTVAETLGGYLWVAEIRRGETREIAMEQMARMPAASPQAPVVLEKKLILEQEDPILDLSLLDGEAPVLLVLEPAKIALYRKQSAGWERQQTVSVPASRPWPRDLRGRLSVQGDSYWAYLPGMVCGGATRPALSANCQGNAPWPVDSGGQRLGTAELAAGRNFFQGRLATAAKLEKNLPPFFSAAAADEHGDWHWIFAGADGRVYLYDQALEPAGSWTGWGSDIAGIGSACGTHAQVLASSAGDRSAGDAIQAYVIVDRRPVTLGDPVRFAGPVTALWPASTGSAAFAVSRDLSTGRYAAFRLAISCSR